MLVDRIHQKLKSNLPSNKSYTILLAISGGVDSVVLLDVLSQIKKRDKLLSNISLVFIDYAINHNSHDRGGLCSSLANQYKYKIIKKDSCLGVKNFESNARYERYRYLNQVANNDKIDFILTAHHRDDQIETLLMKYYDNSDWISYIGIREKYNKIIRPMLDTSKENIFSYAKNNNLFWVEDPSNLDINFRRNELVSLDYDDLEYVQEGLKINLKRSKTDQFGEGTVKALPYFNNNQYCPVVSIKKWIEISKIKTGPLFRRFTKGSKLSETRLTDQTIALIIKKYLEQAGINSENYSGHSLRSGFATSAAEAGAEERSIMVMTGHKSTEMVRRYIKDANLFKNNPLNKIKF